MRYRVPLLSCPLLLFLAVITHHHHHPIFTFKTSSKMANDDLPKTERGWRQSAARHKVKNQSLYMNVKLHSASQVTYKQYLLFRTVLPSIVPPPQLNTQALGIAPLMAQANLLLSDVRFQRLYLRYNYQADAAGLEPTLGRKRRTFQGSRHSAAASHP